MYEIPSNEFKIQFTDLGDERQEGDGADGDSGETNEVRSGMGRLKAGGWNKLFVCLLVTFGNLYYGF